MKFKNVGEAAAYYISKGWPVIPLKPGTKKLVDEGFDMKSRLRFTPSEFQEDDNIGIRSVAEDPDHGLPVIISDADCDEAEALADKFLPKTGAVWGRPSHPRAKRLFHCLGIEKTIAFKDTQTNKTFLELRSNHQDMAPNSTHPNGETLGWAELGEGPTVLADNIIRAHRLLATSCMVSRYYAQPGARHEWGLALAGLLKQLTLTEDEASKVLHHAAEFAGDTKVGDRLTEVRTTYAKGEDDPVAGAKKLADLTSKSFVTTLRKVWGGVESAEASSKIDELNRRHAFLFQQSGDALILSEDQEDERPLLRFSKPSVMELLYPQLVQSGQKLNGDPIFKPLGTVWLKHPKRRAYNGIELCPNNKTLNQNYYNMWRGWSVEPKKGSWPLFREQIDLIAHHNPEHAAYIIAWMAETIQNPQRPIGISLAFRGQQGTGKSTFAKWFGSLFGHHFLHLDSESRLLGRFNAHLHNAILVFADEAVWAGGKQGLGALKRMVTEDTLAIERKGIDTIAVKNMIHMLIASNEDWFVPAGFDDRRFAIFKVSNKRRNDSDFFRAVQKELFEQGGLQALLYDLLEYSSDIDVKKIPKTDERESQQQMTLSPMDEWWQEVLHDGDLWAAENRYRSSDPNEIAPDWDEFKVDRETLYDSYATSIERANRRYTVGSKGALGRSLKKLLPEPYPKSFQSGISKSSPTRQRFWVVPSLTVCRKFYESHHGKIKWETVYDDNREPPLLAGVGPFTEH